MFEAVKKVLSVSIEQNSAAGKIRNHDAPKPARGGARGKDLIDSGIQRSSGPGLRVRLLSSAGRARANQRQQ